MAKLLIKWFQVVVMVSGLMLVTCSWAGDEGESVAAETKRPGYGAVLGDFLIARPLGFVATVVGAAIFVITIPVTAATGTIGEAGATLVVDPAMSTFVRCLGCTENGWRKLPLKGAGDE